MNGAKQPLAPSFQGVRKQLGLRHRVGEGEARIGEILDVDHDRVQGRLAGCNGGLDLEQRIRALHAVVSIEGYGADRVPSWFQTDLVAQDLAALTGIDDCHVSSLLKHDGGAVAIQSHITDAAPLLLDPKGQSDLRTCSGRGRIEDHHSRWRLDASDLLVVV